MIGPLLITIFVAAPEGPGSADSAAAIDPKEQARLLLDEGNTLFADGKHEPALARYEAAYAAYPSPKIFYNLGRTKELLGRLLDAARDYDRFLREAGVEPGSELFEKARSGFARLEPRLARLIHSEGLAHAEIHVDGQRVELTESRPHIVLPGEHDVMVSKPGYEVFRSRIALAPGETKALEPTWIPSIAGVAASHRTSPTTRATPAAVSMAPELESEREEGSILGSWWFWTAVGVVVAAGATSAILVASSEGGTTALPAELGRSNFSSWTPE